ncbi:MAG: DUF4287 domain-containing protein [Planctomycetota bacterium]|nr:MAG: DUF4287 domain-containing protein [Planctomycetota bacterium]
MAKSPDEMAASMIANMPEKTGKSLEQWLKLARAAQKKAPADLAKHGQIVKFLKSEHGMTHGFAGLVAHKVLESDAGSAADTGDLIDAQYAGAKADLRPIYEAIMKGVGSFGKDVEVAPKKAYVSLRRKKQFAIVQPSTKTRVDVGINCKGREPTARLEASGSFNSMVSHRVRVEDVGQVDKQLLGWLRDAYKDA